MKFLTSLMTLLFFSINVYAQDIPKLSTYAGVKTKDYGSFKYYPDNAIAKAFKNKTSDFQPKKNELTARNSAKPLKSRFLIPVAKPPVDFKSNMKVVKPDTSIHYEMRIIRPEN